MPGNGYWNVTLDSLDLGLFSLVSITLPPTSLTLHYLRNISEIDEQYMNTTFLQTEVQYKTMATLTLYTGGNRIVLGTATVGDSAEEGYEEHTPRIYTFDGPKLSETPIGWYKHLLDSSYNKNNNTAAHREGDRRRMQNTRPGTIRPPTRPNTRTSKLHLPVQHHQGNNSHPTGTSIHSTTRVQREHVYALVLLEWDYYYGVCGGSWGLGFPLPCF